MLAFVYALKKFNQFTFGRHITVYSDHKPLEAILKKPLTCVPRCLQVMIMKLQLYDPEVHYEKGMEMHIADFLSHESFQVQSTQQELTLRARQYG